MGWGVPNNNYDHIWVSESTRLNPPCFRQAKTYLETSLTFTCTHTHAAQGGFAPAGWPDQICLIAWEDPHHLTHCLHNDLPTLRLSYLITGPLMNNINIQLIQLKLNSLSNTCQCPAYTKAHNIHAEVSYNNDNC